MKDWFAPYRCALDRYRARKSSALVACINAGLPLALLAGKCALQLELLLADRPPAQGSLW